MTVQTILLVDDNETDRFLHEAVIHSVFPEIKVLQAVNGAEALEILQNVAPDLILLDINMPHMGGLAFLEIYNRDAPLFLCWPLHIRIVTKSKRWNITLCRIASSNR